MKKVIFLLLAAGLAAAACKTSPGPAPAPPPPRTTIEINVELRPGGPLQLGPGEGKGQAITGVQGEEIEPTDIIITFRNESVRDDIRAGTEVNNWIGNLPQGLKVRVREAKKNSNRIILLVDGAPQNIVNEQIKNNLAVSMETMGIEEAKSSGAIALFGEKYEEQVNVYTIGYSAKDFFTKEVCGGPHVERTGTLGIFKIQKEQSSSAGVRRIRAVLE